jgi:hypothetical protein
MEHDFFGAVELLYKPCIANQLIPPAAFTNVYCFTLFHWVIFNRTGKPKLVVFFAELLFNEPHERWYELFKSRYV